MLVFIFLSIHYSIHSLFQPFIISSIHYSNHSLFHTFIIPHIHYALCISSIPLYCAGIAALLVILQCIGQRRGSCTKRDMI